MTEAEVVSYLNERRGWINEALERWLPSETERPAVLARALRYSVLSGGKRLRPILCLAACEAVGGDPRRAIGLGCALEFLHAYSLIHDDLPAADNDDFRRGQPTSHKVFGEAVALLAGDALNSEAFALLVRAAREGQFRPGVALAMVEELAQAAGFQGMVAGQVEDLAKQKEPCTPEELDFIHRHKTAALIRAAVRIGALAGGADAAALNQLSRYGEAIGLAFQIVDDLLDAKAGDGKNPGANYVAVHGRAAAEAQAEKLCAEAVAALKPLGPSAAPLAGLARYIVARRS